MEANGSPDRDSASGAADPLNKPPCIVPECPHPARSTVGLCLRCFNAARKGDERIRQIVEAAQKAKRVVMERDRGPAIGPAARGGEGQDGKDSPMNEKTCKWPDCDRARKKRGLCPQHYQRLFSTSAASRAEAEKYADPPAGKGKPREAGPAKRPRAAAPPPAAEADSGDGTLGEMALAVREVCRHLGVRIAEFPHREGIRLVNLDSGAECWLDPAGGIRPVVLTVGEAP